MAKARSTLTTKHCVPCESGTPPLAAAEIEPLLRQLDGWALEDAKLTKEYSFRNFVEAVDFVNAITPVAESEGHHPDLFVRWGAVRVILWTHSIGGLSENDFILAAKIDDLRR